MSLRPPPPRLSLRTELLAWFAFVGAPAAWTLHLVVGYGMEEIACSPAGGGDIGGVDVEPLIAATTAFAGLVALLSTVAAAFLFRAAGAGRLDDERGRLRFMGAVGIVSGVVFLLIILLGGLQIVALESCA